MGLGLLGRGVGDARFLAEQGAELIVTDLKSEQELAPSLAALQGLPITFRLGGHTLEDFRGRDLVLVAPKTPLDSLYVGEAKKNDIPVSMSTALFAKYAREAGAKVVGVTGTRGKTTTTEMIAHILRMAGKKVLAGGNLRGVSTLALLPEVTPDTICVLELDSWQLQGFGMEKISPTIAVFTNLYPDHQDYYPDMDTYLADKAQIFLHQHPADPLILGESVVETIRASYPDAAARAVVATPGAIPTLLVPGDHNKANAACALAAAGALGVEGTAALTEFQGVSGRLECIAEKNGIRFYNDTTSTTPEATLAALAALGGKKNIVLIMGGYDKGLDMGKLLLEIPKHVKRLIMLSGTGTSRVLEFTVGASVYDSLAAAFEEAVQSAVPGDIVLLSPAFASFGMFKNEYDRGDQFTALVRALP